MQGEQTDVSNEIRISQVPRCGKDIDGIGGLRNCADL